MSDMGWSRYIADEEAKAWGNVIDEVETALAKEFPNLTLINLTEDAAEVADEITTYKVYWVEGPDGEANTASLMAEIRKVFR